MSDKARLPFLDACVFLRKHGHQVNYTGAKDEHGLALYEYSRPGEGLACFVNAKSLIARATELHNAEERQLMYHGVCQI
jgi:hypothetical protein